DRAYSDKNFGGTSIFWDKLFGTFSRLPETPYVFGVGGARSSSNPFWASNVPFMRYLRMQSPSARPSNVLRHSNMSVLSGALLLFTLVVGYIYQYGYG
ncbi:sterol desaturase family protein, partial [Pseudomonas viridiflava]|uniref:sterol desaturase family protein n=1 Tax=Pseudomonas viridiflava TaxID=33069 RepID=UPI003C71DDD5